MSLSALLTHWRSDLTIFENISEWRTVPARPARYVSLPSNLHPGLHQALDRHGIKQFFAHQSEAWNQIENKQNIVLVTGTASGKTLAYNLPTLHNLLLHKYSKALYLFPTKALAQDQLKKLKDLVDGVQSSNQYDSTAHGEMIPLSMPFPAIYDGDTPGGERSTIRQKADILITNPDMLHTGILPHHTRWENFFSSLGIIVIDEIHTYRGVFGSHVANVIRRLKRITEFYGSKPQFILTSATIANPVELAERLIEEPVELINDDGSVHGLKHFLIYNPPVINKDLGLRRSVIQESVRLVGDLLSYNVQTVIFGRARRTVELILSYLQREAGFQSQSVDIEMRGYRSGYLPKLRREIEEGLRQGRVRAVVATNALELGIDIGQLEAAILVGYPGTIASSWQQAGRAGRSDGPSLAVLIASAAPLDQYLAHHPDYFFGRSPERGMINPDNLLILLSHLRCAAFELPFKVGEPLGNVSPEQVREILEFLVENGDMHQSGSRYFWMADQYPAEKVSLRSASPQPVVLQLEENGLSRTLGEVDAASAAWIVHPDAIYLHEAQVYLVENLDLEHNIAYLRKTGVDYFTEPKRQTSVELLDILMNAQLKGAQKYYGEIRVTSQVTGFRKISWFIHENLGVGDLSLPPSELQTTAYWLAIEKETIEELQLRGLWSSSPNDYGPSWPATRDRVRARDGYRCQICGIPEEGRAHDVHHKIPFRLFSSPTEANQLDNLITVCPSCHHRVELAVRVRSGLAGLAYAFSNLAPIFLMCDVRDLGVHSDPRSSIAEGRPTVVIYDQIPAGIGLCERLYEIHDDLTQHALALIKECECTDGCPSCVGPSGELGVGGKKETQAILESIA